MTGPTLGATTTASRSRLRLTVSGEAMLIGVPSRRVGDVWKILGTAGRTAGDDAE